MPNPEVESYGALLWALAVVLLLALGAVLVWTARLRACVGRPIVIARRRRARLAWLAGVALVGGLALLDGEAIQLAPALAVLGLAAASLAVLPGFADSIYGERGVQQGWHARRFEALEEWRLTGDHLRWKLFGLWVACDVPASLHPALRELLERVCPERESQFGR